MDSAARRHPPALLLLVAVTACAFFGWWAARFQLSLGFNLSHLDGEAVAWTAQVIAWSGVALAVPAGLAADMLGARRVALAGVVLIVGGLVAPSLSWSTPIEVLVGAPILGKVLAEVGLIALVADLFRPDDRRRDAAFTLFAFGPNTGGYLAALAGGFLTMGTGLPAVYVLLAVVPLAGALALLKYRPPESATDGGPAGNAGRAVGALALLAALHLLCETAMKLVSLVPVAPPRSLSWLMGSFAVAILLLAPLLAWIWLRLGDREPSSPAKILAGAVIPATGSFVYLRVAGDGAVGWSGLLVPETLDIALHLLLWTAALSIVSRLAPPRFRASLIGVWIAATSVPDDLLFPAIAAVMPEARLQTTHAAVGGLALVLALVAYPVLVRLGRRGWNHLQQG